MKDGSLNTEVIITDPEPRISDKLEREEANENFNSIKLGANKKKRDRGFNVKEGRTKRRRLGDRNVDARDGGDTDPSHRGRR